MLRIDHVVDAEKASGRSIENVRVLLPAQPVVPFGANANESRFLRISKYYREGSYARSTVFACEVPGAFCHIGTGLVCTRDLEVVADSQMEYRLISCPVFKPLRARRLAGTYATINNVFWDDWWHWLVDCLPRLHVLEMAYPGQHIVLLMPENMGRSFDDSLACALPPNFTVQYMPANAWVSVERMLLPSYVSGRCNGHLPTGYYDSIRRAVFARCGLPALNESTERLYVSRARASHRRIINEGELIALLRRYAFRSVAPETMDFKQQVALFHRAEVIVSPHGSNWGNIVFSGRIKAFVLYPNGTPNTHIFTMAKALGQEHFFLAGSERSEHSDFAVDLAAVERVLNDEMGLAAG